MRALIRASRSLPKEFSFVVFDGLRSLLTQQEIADRFRAALATTMITEEERSTTQARFVSPLPKSEAEYRLSPPPHSTGGAIDLGLADREGHVIDLGADFDQFEDIAACNHFEKACQTAVASPTDRARRDARRILYWAMVDAGFAPYEAECWHFELGTRRAAAFQGRSHAEYGPAAPWSRQGWQ